MNTFDLLMTKEFWDAFLDYKKGNENFTSRDEEDLASFIENCEYLPIIEGIKRDNSFSLPTLSELNKKHSDKKRKVFIFPRAENYVLKALSYILGRYDHLFAPNLYSFRKNTGVKRAIFDIVKEPRTRNMYSYKVDISDYFNSVNIDLMLEDLKTALADDNELYEFISSILKEPHAIVNGEKTECKKGIMAGAPISGFLADLYLTQLDKWFESQNAIYARYSDDIIVFAETEQKILEYEKKIKDHLSERLLKVNTKKEFRTSPGEPWEFLGFLINGNSIDLSPVSLQKMKDKMRRKAKALVRWSHRKGVEGEKAAGVFIKVFNRKFYDNPHRHEITWCKWYFPTITSSESLHILDEYMVARIRYIVSGKHSKSNYNLRYEDIKKMGYRSLVNSYYRYKKTDVEKT